jgi:hypothetical protein
MHQTTQSSYVRWTTMQYADGFDLSSQRVYKLIPASGTGTSGTNYDETDFGYDEMDRQNRKPHVAWRMPGTPCSGLPSARPAKRSSCGLDAGHDP